MCSLSDYWKTLANRANLQLFKDTLYTYILDLKANEIEDQESYLGFLSSKVRNQVREGRINKN